MTIGLVVMTIGLVVFAVKLGEYIPRVGYITGSKVDGYEMEYLFIISCIFRHTEKITNKQD
jgi:hypothetical protein